MKWPFVVVDTTPAAVVALQKEPNMGPRRAQRKSYGPDQDFCYRHLNVAAARDH